METGQTHVFTLDCHTMYGPFTSNEYAHEFAKQRRFSSYTLTTRVGWGTRVHAPSVAIMDKEHCLSIAKHSIGS